MLYRDDDDTDNGDDDGGNDVMTHVDEHAVELYRPIDEGDRRFILCDGTTDNATTVAMTMNGNNHFPRKQPTKSNCRAKEAHILETNKASSFGT